MPIDWPLMPSEVFRMHFKPVNFFTQSPAIDMPPSIKMQSKSTLAECTQAISALEVAMDGKRLACCA